MIKSLDPWILVLTLAWTAHLIGPRVTQKSYTPKDLLHWTAVGIGSARIDKIAKALRLTEGKGSKGITLVCPDRFAQNVVFRFEAKPLQPNGVNVILIAISDRATGGPAPLPAHSDGNLSIWTSGSLSNYMAAFHTGFHQPNSYIKRNPGEILIAEAADAATEETWYDIEFSRQKDKLWLKVNGKLVCEGYDRSPEALPGGSVGLRLRGPGDGTYSCLFRNVRIIQGEDP